MYPCHQELRVEACKDLSLLYFPATYSLPCLQRLAQNIATESSTISKCNLLEIDQWAFLFSPCFQCHSIHILYVYLLIYHKHQPFIIGKHTPFVPWIRVMGPWDFFPEDRTLVGSGRQATHHGFLRWVGASKSQQRPGEWEGNTNWIGAFDLTLNCFFRRMFTWEKAWLAD